jgi:hypothetical protein
VNVLTTVGEIPSFKFTVTVYEPVYERVGEKVKVDPARVIKLE